MLGRILHNRSISRWCLIVWWILMYIGTHWPEINRYKPATGWPIPLFGTVVHSSLYAVWATLWWWVLWSRGRLLRGTTLTWFALGAAAYAGFDELTQAFVDRTPRFVDFFTDMAAVTVALMLLRKAEPHLPPVAATESTAPASK